MLEQTRLYLKGRSVRSLARRGWPRMPHAQLSAFSGDLSDMVYRMLS
jgi:hypothetical protein